MGTDIHVAVEVKKKGKWQAFGYYRDCKYHEKEDCYYCNGDKREYVVPMDTSRNYDLFAILANVRNGVGFAGIETGEGFVPVIRKQRGLPDDISETAKRAVTSGDHSFSYLTAADFRAYNWERKTKKAGVISLQSYRDRVAEGFRGKPQSYSGGVWGNDIVTVNEEDITPDFEGAPGQKVYVRVRWEVNYEWHFEPFRKNTVAMMFALAEEHGGDENVRLVFGFDS